jgi:hypothetical protein
MTDGADSERAPTPSKGILKVDTSGKDKSAAILDDSGTWDRRDNTEGITSQNDEILTLKQAILASRLALKDPAN